MEFVVCIFHHFIKDTINTTGLFGLEGFFILSCNSFKVIGESSGFWLSLIVDSKICIWSCICFCSLFFVIEPKWLEKWFTHTSPFWIDNYLCCCLFSVFQFSQKWLESMDSSTTLSWFLTCGSFFFHNVFLYCFSDSL